MCHNVGLTLRSKSHRSRLEIFLRHPSLHHLKCFDRLVVRDLSISQQQLPCAVEYSHQMAGTIQRRKGERSPGASLADIVAIDSPFAQGLPSERVSASPLDDPSHVFVVQPRAHPIVHAGVYEHAHTPLKEASEVRGGGLPFVA
jgi:hypothetical protein